MATSSGGGQGAAAYGGPGWSPRRASLGEELGSVWARCGADSEYGRLEAVLLHRPGPELVASLDPDRVQMLEPLDAGRAAAEHDLLADAYRAAGAEVRYVDPQGAAPPNLLFAADLFFMTREGAILGRPASTVRAGEERLVARRLADLGIPLLRSIRGRGTFEGADALWVDARTVLLGLGLRTNAEGAAQVAAALAELAVETIVADLPAGAMHLMGLLRLVDGDLALAWPGRLPDAAARTFASRGIEVRWAPDEGEAARGMALNLVAVAPRRVVMAAGNPRTRAWLEAAGVGCTEVGIGEVAKAAGGIGCLTGVLGREPSG